MSEASWWRPRCRTEQGGSRSSCFVGIGLDNEVALYFLLSTG